jgi:hypothetical protein
VLSCRAGCASNVRLVSTFPKRRHAAVAAAYGWPADSTDEQILERLLALNLERAAEETKASKTTKPKISRQKNGDELI